MRYTPARQVFRACVEPGIRFPPRSRLRRQRAYGQWFVERRPMRRNTKTNGSYSRIMLPCQQSVEKTGAAKRLDMVSPSYYVWLAVQHPQQEIPVMQTFANLRGYAGYDSVYFYGVYFYGFRQACGTGHTA